MHTTIFRISSECVCWNFPSFHHQTRRNCSKECFVVSRSVWCSVRHFHLNYYNLCCTKRRPSNILTCRVRYSVGVALLIFAWACLLLDTGWCSPWHEQVLSLAWASALLDINKCSHWHEQLNSLTRASAPHDISKWSPWHEQVSPGFLDFLTENSPSLVGSVYTGMA